MLPKKLTSSDQKTHKDEKRFLGILAIEKVDAVGALITPPRSPAGVRRTLPESTRVRRSPPESGRVWRTPAGLNWTKPDSPASAKSVY